MAKNLTKSQDGLVVAQSKKVRAVALETRDDSEKCATKSHKR